MIRGFYSSASGLISQQANLNIIANNMANASTTAYKPQQASFSALMYENVNGGAGNQVQIGHGTKVQATGIDFTQGELKKTDRPLDYAIIGEGFFALKAKEDEVIRFTRDGNFQKSVEGSTSFLVNGRGDYVLDENKEKIEIKEGFDSSKFGIYSFDNIHGLVLAGGGQYEGTEFSGEAKAHKESSIQSGYLENSRVQVGEEMVRMIEASKGFSFNAKLIQTADEMEKTINQLR